MQKLVSRFIEKYKLHTSAEIRYIDLVSEIGELGGEIAKSTDYGKKELMKNEKIQDEIGDCLFSLLALFEEFGIDAEEALKNAICKYENRFKE
ncbi:MAG: MazG-like family protein [Defluviitaleaceae bacterium]|nr:MazG-like family protein [Defluviitaleaceae bacterium]